MTLWITYVVNDVTMAVSMVTGFYHGICDLNMLLGKQSFQRLVYGAVDGGDAAVWH